MVKQLLIGQLLAGSYGDVVMKKRTREAINGGFLVMPIAIGCLIFYLIPFCMVFQYSMRSSAGKNSSFVGLKHYVELLNNEMFRLAYGNTFHFLGISIPLILVISYAVALVLKSRAEQYKVLKSILLLPYTMPIVGTILMVEVLFADTGLLNEALYTMGLPVKDWLESSWAFAVVFLVYIWKNTGYNVILLLAGLMTIPKDQYAAANLDGAGSVQRFLYITMPQMWYSVFFAFLFSLINAFKCFREIFLIGGKHPNTEIYMLQHFLNNSFENLNYSKLSVASILFFIPLILILGLAYGWVRRKEDYKG